MIENFQGRLMHMNCFIRVSPEYQDEDLEYSKRGRSAPMKKKKDEGRISPPDPLEPWSTRELQNINKILAKK